MSYISFSIMMLNSLKQQKLNLTFFQYLLKFNKTAVFISTNNEIIIDYKNNFNFLI